MQSVVNVAANILRQLLSSFPDVPDDMIELLEDMRSDARHFLEPSKIMTMISEIAPRFSSVWVIVDALDECENTSHRCHLVKFFQHLAACKIRLFVTCRPHVQPPDNVAVLDIRAHSEDIETYLRAKLEDTCIQHGLREEIVSNLLATAERTYAA